MDTITIVVVNYTKYCIECHIVFYVFVVTIGMFHLMNTFKILSSKLIFSSSTFRVGYYVSPRGTFPYFRILHENKYRVHFKVSSYKL